MGRKLQLQHSWISVKWSTVQNVIFYYLSSNDMASMKLYCNGSIVSYYPIRLQSFFVSWNHTHSPSLNLNICVPHCSILRRLLFLIYIQYTILLIPVISCHSFALLMTPQYNYVQHDSNDGAIQILISELAKVAEWFDSNKMTLNVNKTQMIMPSRKKLCNLT